MSLLRLAVLLCVSGVSGVCCDVAAADTDFLIPHLQVGDNFSNVFSIASSIKAEGFDDQVGRNSGSGDYTLKQQSADHALNFDARFVYDGSAADRAENIIRDGGATQCWKGECRQSTDASGLLYNRLLWGDPPKVLKAGLAWKVEISQPWEMGPAGTQTVTVIHVDTTDGSVTMKREGNAKGTFAGEAAEVTLMKGGKKFALKVSPGLAHWIGYTTFRHGIVISDELLFTRTDALESEQTGVVRATRRRYMLLNAAPYPTL